MKIIISESRIKDAIIKFLDVHVTPDYGWVPDLYDEEIKRWGYVDFFIDDYNRYSYFVKFKNRNPKTLELMLPLTKQLDSLFGKYWIPVFKEWFEKNSNLKINELYFDKGTDEPNIIKLNESDNSFVRRYGVIEELIDESFDVLRDEVCEHTFPSFLDEVCYQVSDKMNYMDIPDGRDNARMVHKWVEENFYDYIKDNFEKLLMEEDCSESFDDYIDD